MTILHISTSERTGGAAIAARRLCEALIHKGVDSQMLVRDRQTSQPWVHRVGTLLPKIVERLTILPRCGFHYRQSWLMDTGEWGVDIFSSDAYKRADVVHLHWVAQGMLSLSSIQRILDDGKRLIWTLHDEWPFAGVCHYRGECLSSDCAACPLMKGSLPNRLFKRKKEMLENGNVTFVGCSKWMADKALAVFPRANVRHICNPIPYNPFHPIPMKEARRQMGLPQDERLLLFCSQKVTDERKGMRYLLQALDILQQRSTEKLRVLVAGASSSALHHPLLLPVGNIGSEERMAALYASADAFVTPSLQDNLPNTIAEAMSVGTPCVGFRVGGVPEMISHLEDGYVAEPRKAEDLAEGILFVLSHDLREKAALHANEKFGEEHITQQFMELYEG